MFMKSWLRMASVLCVLVLLFALNTVADSQQPKASGDTFDDPILRAGNAEDEKERYKLLKELEQLDIDKELREELSKLLPVVDQWANGREKYWESGDKKRAAENGYLCGFFVSKFRLTGDRKPLENSLMRNAAAFRVNREGYTSEVRWTDRVFVFHRYVNTYANPQLPTPGTHALYCSVTGDFGNPLYFPMNAVRWKTIPQDITVLVTDSGNVHFSAELYHFGKTSRKMGAELYLLNNGEYEWTITADEDESEELSRGRVIIDGSRASIHFSLPPRRLCTLRICRLEGSDK